LGHKLSKAFHDKWAGYDKSTAGQEVLTSVDPSALADYNAVYETVREMHIIPMTLRGYLTQIIILLTPFVPLVFLQMPLSDVIKRLLDTLL